jgi:hypothetical protein
MAMMKKLISTRLAGNILLVCFGLLVVFHVLVVNKIVPSHMVWGGRFADSSSQLFLYEIIALLVLILFMLLIASKIGYFKVFKSEKALNVCIWVIFVYMLLNFLGNLASPVSAEKWIFAPLTLIMAVLVLRMAVEK